MHSSMPAPPAARQLGIGLEELAAATGIMADSGIQGSQAGTTLRSALTSLASPTDEARGSNGGDGIQCNKCRRKL